MSKGESDLPVTRPGRAGSISQIAGPALVSGINPMLAASPAPLGPISPSMEESALSRSGSVDMLMLQSKQPSLLNPLDPHALAQAVDPSLCVSVDVLFGLFWYCCLHCARCVVCSLHSCVSVWLFI